MPVAEGLPFNMKDYADNARVKPLTILGTEFLRRFCLHILPKSFVRIRHFGICSSRFRARVLSGEDEEKMLVPQKTTKAERVVQINGFDIFCCPACRKGRMLAVAVIPRARSPDALLPAKPMISC